MKNTVLIIMSLPILFLFPVITAAEDIVIESFDTFAIEGRDIWLATDTGVVLWNKVDGVKNLFTVEDGLAGLPVRSIVVDNDGVKWFGTGKGLSRFDGSSWTTFTKNDGLPISSILSCDRSKQYTMDRRRIRIIDI